MKKIKLFTLFMLINIGLISAQTDQGKMLIGASSNLGASLTGSDFINIGYSSIKNKGDADGEYDPYKIMTISLLPKVGYFVADNMALGLDLNVAFTKTRSDIETSQRLISTGPFIRYYIPTSKVLPFVEINSSFGRTTNKIEFDDNSVFENRSFKTNVMSLGGGIGLAVPLTDRVAFDVLAGYNSLTRTDKNENVENYRTVSDSLGLKIGFIMFLGSN